MEDEFFIIIIKICNTLKDKKRCKYVTVKTSLRKNLVIVNWPWFSIAFLLLKVAYKFYICNIQEEPKEKIALVNWPCLSTSEDHISWHTLPVD